ncbi:MAG: S8 family serine peptidase [Bacteroidia bacterium]
MIRNKMRIWIGILLLGSSLFSIAQVRHQAFLIEFTDKVNNSNHALSQKAIDRRAKFNIALDNFDLPVNVEYIKAICRDSTIRLRYPLKWRNAIVIDADSLDMDAISKLPFVSEITYVGLTSPFSSYEQPLIHDLYSTVKNSEIQTSNLNRSQYGNSYDQLYQVGITRMHSEGFDGSGVSIAVFDAGFQNAHVLSSFARARSNHQLYSAYDLVDLDNELTDVDNHGIAVSSCFLSYSPSQYIGSSPNVTTYLFRTENSFAEDPLEELNWCRAAELADSIGVDMVSSSLGYTQFDNASLNYTHSDMDGKTSHIAKAASMLVEKGVLVVNSAGNEGDDPWRKIGSPGDVAKVLTIGAVNSNNEISNFSSRGNNANGITKPDVCALGVKTFVSSTYGSFYRGFGTSYATPIVSGGVALLLQAHPDKPPQEITDALRLTAQRNNFPDSIYGYGTVNIYAAHLLLLNKGKDMAFLADSTSMLLVYNDGFTELNYKLYERKSFLLVFNRLKKVHTGVVETKTPLTYLNLGDFKADCNEKYTLKIKLRSAVDNYKLKHNDLSLCTP